MDEALTGRDAAEAISLAVQLGNRGARFDGRRVFRDLRTHAGRIRVAMSMTSFAGWSGSFPVETPRRDMGRRSRRAGRVLRLAAATEVPGRPPSTPEREGASHGLA
jgi:hypothetical protein